MTIVEPAGIQPVNSSTIRPGVRAFDVPFNSSLRFRCFGTRELTWAFPENYVDENDYIGRWVKFTHNCVAIDEYGGKRCISEVVMPTTDPIHTGFYVCHYSDIENPRTTFEEQEHHSKSKSLLSSTVFIFVNQEGYLLTPHDTLRGVYFMSFVSGYPVTIPCVPTSSNIEVTLWRVANSTYKEQIIPNPNLGVTWDPTIGFSYERVTWNPDFPVVMECHARDLIRGYEEVSKVIIHWSFDPGRLHPIILDDDAKYVYVGSSFTLTCQVKTLGARSVVSRVYWEYPVKHEHRVRYYIDNKPFGSEYLDDDDDKSERFEDVVRSRLIVHNVTLADAGVYKCIVNVVTGTPFDAEHVIKVHTSPPSSSLFSSESSWIEYPNGTKLESENGDKGVYVVAPDLYRSKKTTVIMISILLLIIVSVAIMAIYFGRSIRRRHEDIEKLRHSQFRYGFNLFYNGQDLINPELPLEEQVELLPYDSRFEFPRDRLKFGKTLGQGAFGRVVKAEAIGIKPGESQTTVAVKMLKERVDVEQKKALIAELKILIHLGRHLNIVNLIGACTVGFPSGELLVIVEYCKYGNLQQFLLKCREWFIDQINPLTSWIDPDICSRPLCKRNHDLKKYASVTHYNSPISEQQLDQRQSKNDDKVVANHIQRIEAPLKYASLEFHPNISSMDICSALSNIIDLTENNEVKKNGDNAEGDDEKVVIKTRDLICYAWQVARGMEYLSSRKLIHRDLAARNVLLSDDFVVKICDFGMSKKCYVTEEYVKRGDGPLPIKWLAIESMRDKVFNTKSDVWSFGILCWEIFSLGETPYPGMEVDHEFYRKVKDGYRLEKPTLCPNRFYDNIIYPCWFEKPDDRPSFSNLITLLGSYLESSVRDYYVDLNIPYQDMNRALFGINNEYSNTRPPHEQKDKENQVPVTLPISSK